MSFPCIYINHGGGPLPLMGAQPDVASFLGKYASSLPMLPTAILLVSAHWEEDAVVAVHAGAQPDLLYDYGGFPPETYAYRYPARGSPAVAARVLDCLQAAGIEARTELRRGWDHGVFVPMKLAFPAANVPIVQVSLLRSQDAGAHLRLGAALAPLRTEGVLIVGSGASFHNFGYLFERDPVRRAAGAAHSHKFDEWLRSALQDPHATPVERLRVLEDWSRAPSARECHPAGAAEHLTPLFVVAGAGRGESAAAVGGSEERCSAEAGGGDMTSEFAFSQFEWR